MPSRKDIEELIAARKARQPRTGVSQVDPAEVVGGISSEERVPDMPTPEEPPVVITRPPEVRPKKETATSSPLPAPDSLQLTAFSTYIYRDRQRQLKLEAISTGKKVWEIVE